MSAKSEVLIRIEPKIEMPVRIHIAAVMEELASAKVPFSIDAAAEGEPPHSMPFIERMRRVYKGALEVSKRHSGHRLYMQAAVTDIWFKGSDGTALANDLVCAMFATLGSGVPFRLDIKFSPKMPEGDFLKKIAAAHEEVKAEMPREKKQNADNIDFAAFVVDNVSRALFAATRDFEKEGVTLQ
jgi:hypothetical protein